MLVDKVQEKWKGEGAALDSIVILLIVLLLF